jgi:phenylalanyl-tRNA synthetase alpha chain
VTDLPELQADAVAAAAAADDLDELDEVRVRFTGKRSPLVDLAAGDARPGTPEERKARGQQLNAFKAAFATAYDARHAELAAAALRARLEGSGST